MVWLACLAVDAGCGGRVWSYRFFWVFLLKRFTGGGLRGLASDGDGAF